MNFYILPQAITYYKDDPRPFHFLSLYKSTHVKIKLLCKNLGVIMFANFLMGCAEQLTEQGNAEAQENVLSVTAAQSSTPVKTTPLLQEEYIYKILVAEIAGQRGQYTLSTQYFLDIAEKTRDPRFAERATQVALYSQEDTLALQAAQLWVTLYPKNASARQVLTGVLLRQNRVDDAVPHFEEMLKIIGDNANQRSETVSSLLEPLKDQNNALKLLEKVLPKRPTDSVILIVYARLLMGANQLDRATETLQQLLKVAPEHEQGVLLYAHVLDKQDKTAQALQWLQPLLNKKPDKQEWRFLYAQLLASHQQFADAIQQFQELLTKNPQNYNILYALGILSIQVEQPKDAKRYFTDLLKNTDLLKDNEQSDVARYYLGQVAEMEKKLDEALSWYNKVNAGASYLNAQARIAVILDKQGFLEKALEHLHTVSINDPEDKVALVQLEAELLIEHKRYADAMTVYNTALTEWPKNVDLLYMRAMLAEKMNRLEQLEQDLRQVLAIEPQNVQALNALGYTLADRTNRYQEAYDLVKKALELRPEDHYILDSMGWVSYRLGKNQEAIEYLRKAQAKKDDPEIAAHLGEVLWVSGNQQEAKAVWKKAQETFPDDEQLRATIKRFLP